MKFGIVRFPGSNCDSDCHHVVADVLGEKACYLWHEERDLSGADCVILPGGFAHGDYLRVGAMARLSPIMDAIKEFAGNGGLVLGICNGFQVLTESGLLPGALLKNSGGKFVCDWAGIEVENGKTPFTSRYGKGQILRMPVAHGEGRYFLEGRELKRLEEKGGVVFRYTEDVNGSVASIAGISNPSRNVLGLMPHPERCAEPVLGGTDGLLLFKSIVESAKEYVS